MNHQLKTTDNNRLSLKLMQWVLVAALVVGFVLSSVQILLDADSVISELKRQSEQTLAIIQDSATQAVYSIDPDLGAQVIEGLFEQEAIIHARIVHPDNTILAEKIRPAQTYPSRWLTDLIFEPELKYIIDLEKNLYDEISYGHLEVTVDTAHAAQLFLKRALVVLVSGIIKAVILAFALYLVYHVFLTRPLKSIIQSLVKVNPSNPADHVLNVPKNHDDDELGTWVRTANKLLVEISSNQKKRKDAEARALKLSRYDPLTGLPNRRLFINQLESALNDSRQLNQRLAILCCGIDDFKLINEQTSYQVGDELLRQFSERLSLPKEVPINVSRLGGDQFALLLYNISDAFFVSNYADQLLAELEQPFSIGSHNVTIHCTIGVSIFPDDENAADKLLQKAEQTMLLAKTENRRHCQFYVEKLDQEMRERRHIEKDLAHAIENQELFLVYQPQIDYRTNSVVGVEALLRWQHPIRGFVPPDVFIPIAESSSLILDIGNWVINEACHQASTWLSKGRPLKVAINLSAVQTNHPDTQSAIFNALSTYRLPSELIEVEITETGIMKNVDMAVRTLSQFREKGIHIALDDFGTGYSSLSYLKKLPIDKLKIDKQFINDLLDTTDNTNIVNAIIQLGKSMGLKVIAEGVETQQQEDYLRTNGCELGQGYYYSKPLTPDMLEDVFTRFALLKSEAKTVQAP